MTDEPTREELQAEITRLQQEIEALYEELWATRIEPTRWVTQRCVEEFGLVVRAGPFAGLRFLPESVGESDALVAKLLGAYEREVHQPIRSMIAAAPRTFVNVGCADGLYSVGFALASPSTRVLAFDTQPAKRDACAALAAANGVADRVSVGSECPPEVLANLEPGDCVMLDCEGCELELISDEEMPGLRRASVLIELHDAVDRAVTGTIQRRLMATHQVELIDSEPRNIDDFPELASFLGWNNRQVAIWEFRPRPMRWAFLTPREL